MQLSVEVQRQNGTNVFVCRGSLVQGQSSDYLLDLITRSTRRDIILDLAEVVELDGVGLQALQLSSTFLAGFGRQLLLRRACSEFLERLSRLRLVRPFPPHAEIFALACNSESHLALLNRI